MAKTIKFNLIVDGYPARKIEDIQNNFSVEDILKYYENGLLEKWLECRGYTEQYKRLKEIKESEASIDELSRKAFVLEKLINLFEMEIKNGNVDGILTMLNFQADEVKLFEKYESEKYDRDSIIDDYFSGYEKLKTQMVKDKNNFSKLRAYARCIENKYKRLFDMDYSSLYDKLSSNEAPMAIYAILTREALRDEWLKDKTIKNKILNLTYGGYYKDKETSNNWPRHSRNVIKNIFIGNDELKEFFNNSNDNYWKDIEDEDKTIMVLLASSNLEIRQNSNEKISQKGEEINEDFPIYKGSSIQCKGFGFLLYVEV